MLAVRVSLFSKVSLFSSKLHLSEDKIRFLGYPCLMKWVDSINAFFLKSAILEQIRLTSKNCEYGIPLRICLGCSDEYNKYL